jgi:hypothetical protein
MTALGARRPLDIYLQPAVVGGGLGDIEEVLAIGRRLERLGWTPLLYRKPGRPLPPSVEGPWGWPSVRRIYRLVPRSLHALTVTPWWGVSAAPTAERTGPPGPWSAETADIKARYGSDRVVHLSIEEFARTLTSRQQTRERWREGGVAVKEISRRLNSRTAARGIRIAHNEYRKWRAFGRPNVLHLFTGFRPSRAFQQEFSEAIQTGPLWPEPPAGGSPRTVDRRWLWYASPSTSSRLAAALAEAVPDPSPGSPPVEIEVRGPRRFAFPNATGVRWRWSQPVSPEKWSRRFRSAELRLVTGSRTLLEALAVGGPFLYFNGVLNEGRRTRRHRPEKIEGLLEVWRRHRVAPSLRRDLADFSRLRRVAPIVRNALTDPRWAKRFPAGSVSVDHPPGWADAGRLIDRWSTDWASSTDPASVVVGRWRARARNTDSYL